MFKNKIYNYITLELIKSFILILFSLSLIAWTVRAVNFLDLVSDDGHSLNVYFYYISLNLPKIFSKTIIFVFFISIFYVTNCFLEQWNSEN